MDRLAKWFMVIGGIIFVLAGCALDSAGAYGYIAGVAAIAGGIIAGFGYGLHVVAERNKSATNCRQLKMKSPKDGRGNEDITWIEEA